MKSNKGFRDNGVDQNDLMKKHMKLEPNKRSGKDRIVIEDEEDEEIYHPRKESILDYYDDNEEDDNEDEYEDDEYEDDEEYDEDEEYDGEDEEEDEYDDDEEDEEN